LQLEALEDRFMPSSIAPNFQLRPCMPAVNHGVPVAAIPD
jgi:hypothetical protein